MRLKMDATEQLNIVLVDDEEIARNRLNALLSEIDCSNIHIVGEAKDGKEALKLIPKAQPDVVFLDIQMPVLDGFDVAEMLPEPRPNIIFATAYDEHALKAFEVHAVDYLLKPIRKERLSKAIERVTSNQQSEEHQIHQLLQSRQAPMNRVGVHYKQEILLLEAAEILWFEAEGKLVYAVTEERKFRADFNLEQLSVRLGSEFIRSHRSYLVNTAFIKKLIPWFNNSWRLEMINGTQLEVARRRVSELKQRLGLRH